MSLSCLCLCSASWEAPPCTQFSGVLGSGWFERDQAGLGGRCSPRLQSFLSPPPFVSLSRMSVTTEVLSPSKPGSEPADLADRSKHRPGSPKPRVFAKSTVASPQQRGARTGSTPCPRSSFRREGHVEHEWHLSEQCFPSRANRTLEHPLRRKAVALCCVFQGTSSRWHGAEAVFRPWGHASPPRLPRCVHLKRVRLAQTLYVEARPRPEGIACCISDR